MNTGGFKKYRGQTKRLNACTKTNHLVMPVTKNHINGILHKKHVDGLAMRDDQGLALREIFLPKQPLHSSPRISGHFNMGSNYAITDEVSDHGFQKWPC